MSKLPRAEIALLALLLAFGGLGVLTGRAPAASAHGEQQKEASGFQSTALEQVPEDNVKGTARRS